MLEESPKAKKMLGDTANEGTVFNCQPDLFILKQILYLETNSLPGLVKVRGSARICRNLDLLHSMHVTTSERLCAKQGCLPIKTNICPDLFSFAASVSNTLSKAN